MMIVDYIQDGMVVNGIDAGGSVIKSIPVDEKNADYQKYLVWKNGITEPVSLLPVLPIGG